MVVKAEAAGTVTYVDAARIVIGEDEYRAPQVRRV